ncbi:Clp protease ClpP [Parashewanella curva]|uniref:ATP-dependent Clp protease proteolytic subunit n=2 Tax=Parashewanella curva TaxID=2338552 RepID=A0A3L8Q032_9GAMM|nr:Clp protease ClpP [Parashewanella curva]
MIYDEIGGWGISAQQFARELSNLGKVTQITARIHSPGGDVFEGMAIYNLLKGHPAHKVCHIDGLAASMASVIAMAFDEVIMPANAMMMVHKPWGGTIGDADEMRKYADLLDKVESTLISAYQTKTGMDETELQSLLAEETWLTGSEAVEKGFADTLSEPLQMAAALNSKRLKDFENMPEALKNLFAPQGNAPVNNPPAANPQGNVADPQPAPAAPAATVQPTHEQIAAANKQRIDGINAAFKGFDNLTELKNECIANADIDAAAAKDKILAKLGEGAAPAASQPQSTIIHAGNGNLVGDSIRAHLLTRAGHQKAEKDNQFSSFNLMEMARASLTERGISSHGMNKMEMVGKAFTHSSSDFGQILLDVANKSVLMGWEKANETFELWTKKGELSDFKPTRRVGLGEFSSLPEVPEGAEYTYGTIGDHGANITLASYGKLFSITRQAIINDDLNMLKDIPMKMGAAAKATIADLVYELLTGNAKWVDGKPLFHADHNNLTSGEHSVENYGIAAELMETQTGHGEDGRDLNIMPEFLICHPSKKRLATQIIKSSSVKGADANSGIYNPVQDFATVISEARLKAAKDAYYLSAAQGTDTIEVAYLDGIDTPYIEQQEGFNVDGVSTKVRMDAGVAALDFRGLVKSTGK